MKIKYLVFTIPNTRIGLKITKNLKKYQKSEKIEKILVEKSLTSSSAWIRFFDQTITRLKFKMNNKDLTEAEILNLLNSQKS